MLDMESPVQNDNALKLKIVTEVPDLVAEIRNLFLKVQKDRELEVEIEYFSRIEQDDLHGIAKASTELHFKVRADSWQKWLILMCQVFQRMSQDAGHVNEFAPLLVVSEPGFFSDYCMPAQLDIPLTSFSFGNFWRVGRFLSHFKREAFLNETPEEKCLKVARHYLDPDRESSMFVDFEHDRGIITVLFAVCGEKAYVPERECQKGKSAADQFSGCMYAIRVKYDSIRRLVVDPYASIGSSLSGTRVYILLNYPPEIKRLRTRYFYSGDRRRSIPEKNYDNRDNCTAINESPMLCLEFNCKHFTDDSLYLLLSRLNSRTRLPIEFMNISVKYFPVSEYLSMPVRVIGTDYRSSAQEKKLRDSDVQYVRPEPNVDEQWSARLRNTKCFGLEYLIAALITRGAIIKDQILIFEREKTAFLSLVLEEYNANSELALEGLERLLNFVDETKQMPSLLMTYKKILRNLKCDRDILHELLQRNEEGGYARVRKMIVTPTRTLLVVPELLMGNRVLRNYDETGDGALRVQFRDDDGTKLRKNSTGAYFINTTVHNTLYHGVYISDRHFVYLASSNSQMRDNGCYFFDDGPGNQVQKIRESLGKFDKTNIPKLMSRMGQCFTQAEQCEAKLERNRYNKTFDFIGGKDANGDPYTFSDGVGKISYEFAREIANTMQMGSCVPSCYQIRYRGIKGVLSVDPAMDARQKWAEENGVKDSNKTTQKTIMVNVLFRPSQDKFNAPRNCNIEIVKFSSPVPVCLNRPLICIMDQVSEMQGFELHQRVVGRIHALLDRQLMQMAEILMSEDRCRERLNELPRRIFIDFLSTAKGFALTQEPFFRSLLHASAKYTLKKHLMKEQIQIPYNLGRSMFGVVDETGLLQYGQVFIQYTHSVELKTPGPHAAKTILKGRVMITKNPSVVAGDVRMFEAVDVPELRHLVDVVVFPQSGPRPHPDEMAGSDLDGDEYSVMWDPDLFFDHNEEPFDFTKDANPPQNISEDEVVAEMRDFFVMYIKQDSIGSISNAFLINADLYGIKSEVCKSIARKHSKSVDFPKTGNSPERLVNCWREIEGIPVPPERPERSPDFMSKNHEPFYASRRLVGQLFRRIKAVDDVLTLTMASEGVSMVMIDESLLYPNYEGYEDEAEKDFAIYAAYVNNLMDNYGIEDEGQLFSGCISVLRNRLSEKDNDDMSLYNTNHMIEQKVTDLFRKFRKKFFEEFGGIEACTVPGASREFLSFEKDLRRICANPSESMKMKASAYYYVCYTKASQSSGKRLLSFPWLVWDILAQIKLTCQSSNLCIAMSVDPLSNLISEFIDEYCEVNVETMQEFTNKLITGTSGSPPLLRYCRKYTGLDKLIYVLCEWAMSHELLSGRFNCHNLSLLLIQFLIGHYITYSSKANDSLLARVDFLLPEDSDEIVDIKSMVGGSGKLFIRFLQFLSSRSFETLKYIDFSQPNLEYQSKMIRGQWLDLHKAALKSFYRLMLKGRFDELPLTGIASKDTSVTEMEPFVIEVPETIPVSIDELKIKMANYCGVDCLALRRIPDRRERMVISAKGTLESLHRLRELVTVESVTNSQISDKEKSNMMVRLVYERIQHLCA